MRNNLKEKIISVKNVFKNGFGKVDNFFSKEPELTYEYIIKHLLIVSYFDVSLFLCKDIYIKHIKSDFTTKILNIINRDPLCKTKKQKCVTLVYLWLITFILFGLINRTWWLYKPLSILPILDLNNYITGLGNSPHAIHG